METVYDLGQKMIEALNKEKVAVGYVHIYLDNSKRVSSLSLGMLLRLTRRAERLVDLEGRLHGLATTMQWDQT
jgi:hypothetical protein